MNKKMNPLEYANELTEHWSPRIISNVDDYYIKVARLKGEITWHQHKNEDELFLILKGALTIELENESVILNEGDMYVVQKGVLHNPVAKEECLVLLFEKNSTEHTGEIKHEKSRSHHEQLRVLDLKNNLNSSQKL
ncbi:MAG: cupin domain-containing protein [Colwellia sp.]|nr:cupin domain-containing protein [Colwellia sp.]